MNKEQYLRLIKSVIESPRNNLQKINMLEQGFKLCTGEPSKRMYYAGVDMTDWDLTFDTNDTKFIYKAFIAVCNFAEEISGCAGCPLNRLCMGSNDGDKFWHKVHSELGGISMK